MTWPFWPCCCPGSRSAPRRSCRCPAHPIRGCDALEPQPRLRHRGGPERDPHLVAADATAWRTTAFSGGCSTARRCWPWAGRTGRPGPARPGFDERTRAPAWRSWPGWKGSGARSMDRAADAFAALLAGAAEEEPDPVRAAGAGADAVPPGPLDLSGGRGGRPEKGRRSPAAITRWCCRYQRRRTATLTPEDRASAGRHPGQLRPDHGRRL